MDITLIQNRAINAFVTTGNRMFIHTGLILQAGSAAELAGVLAHETGHIAGGHLARLPEEMRMATIRSVAAMLLGAGAAVATGQGGAFGAIALGGQSSAMGGLFAFTRGQEQAADQAGLHYLETVGWSAAGLERLLERLLDQELLAVGRQDPYFRTHPLSQDRLEFVREQMRRSRSTPALMPAALEGAFAMAKAKLHGFLDPPQRVLRQYPAEDSGAPARYARAIMAFRAGRIAEAVAGLESLLAAQPGNPWLHEMKGQVLFEGHRAAEALPAYAAAARLAPAEPLIRTAHARVMIELGDPALLPPAVAELEASPALDRDSAFTGGSSASPAAGSARCRWPTSPWRRRRCWRRISPPPASWPAAPRRRCPRPRPAARRRPAQRRAARQPDPRAARRRARERTTETISRVTLTTRLAPASLPASWPWPCCRSSWRRPPWRSPSPPSSAARWWRSCARR
ncbi:M48 family metalloprotease [Teichococcus aestuarii]|uniref:M48 family metalloprotease n=1 Tax=Teichococcus aestuarii TaxID=568898 RepID=UPI003621C30A